VDPNMCNPIIVNQTAHSIVLFLDRGVLYNKQVLQPGEAVGMTRKETAGMIMPYRIHAVVGDAKSLPTRRQSIKNLASTAVIPTAFLIGTFMAASSAGTMTGPSAALSRMAGGVVVRGMVIDSAALAAGSLAANRAAFVADKLIERYPENFSCRTGLLMPGNRCVVVRGGIEEPLTITTITTKDFKQIAIEAEVKTPMDTLQDKLEYYTPNMFQRSATKNEVEPDAAAAAIEAGEAQAAAAITQAAPPSTAPGAIEAQQADADEEEQLRRAIEASTAPPVDDDEEEQFRKAIEESLKIEEQRKRKDEAYQKQLKDGKSKPVTIF